MTKHLYLIGGTMGVGKTTVGKILKDKLANSVYLDGDWCWDMHPFSVTEETKRMVMENIAFLLNNFLRCSAYEHIVFCWVMHEQAIIDELLSRIDTTGCETHVLSLVCGEEALKERIERDIEKGLRTPGDPERSVLRLPLYEKLDSIKIDCTSKTPPETAEAVLAACGIAR